MLFDFMFAKLFTISTSFLNRGLIRDEVVGINFNSTNIEQRNDFIYHFYLLVLGYVFMDAVTNDV